MKKSSQLYDRLEGLGECRASVMRLWQAANHLNQTRRRLNSGINLRSGEPLKPSTLKYYQNCAQNLAAFLACSARKCRVEIQKMRAQAEMRSQLVVRMAKVEGRADVIPFPIARRLNEIREAAR